jgi:hypothetical protein
MPSTPGGQTLRLGICSLSSPSLPFPPGGKGGGGGGSFVPLRLYTNICPIHKYGVCVTQCVSHLDPCGSPPRGPNPHAWLYFPFRCCPSWPLAVSQMSPRTCWACHAPAKGLVYNSLMAPRFCAARATIPSHLMFCGVIERCFPVTSCSGVSYSGGCQLQQAQRCH